MHAARIGWNNSARVPLARRATRNRQRSAAHALPVAGSGTDWSFRAQCGHARRPPHGRLLHHARDSHPVAGRHQLDLLLRHLLRIGRRWRQAVLPPITKYGVFRFNGQLPVLREPATPCCGHSRGASAGTRRGAEGRAYCTTWLLRGGITDFVVGQRGACRLMCGTGDGVSPPRRPLMGSAFTAGKHVSGSWSSASGDADCGEERASENTCVCPAHTMPGIRKKPRGSRPDSRRIGSADAPPANSIAGGFLAAVFGFERHGVAIPFCR